MIHGNSFLRQADDAMTADIISIMIEKERSTYRCHDYLRGSNVVVTADDRQLLIDWCFNIVDLCSFQRETVAIAANLLDRFLSVPSDYASLALQDRREFQLLMMSSLYIAIKTNERVAFSSEFLSAASRGGYTIEEIEYTEKMILCGLSWRVNGPTSLQMVLHILSLMQVGKILPSESLNNLLNEVQYQTEVATRVYNLSIQRSSTTALTVLLKTFQQLSHDMRVQLYTSLLPVLRSFDFDSRCKRSIAAGFMQSERERRMLTSIIFCSNASVNSCNVRGSRQGSVHSVDRL